MKQLFYCNVIKCKWVLILFRWRKDELEGEVFEMLLTFSDFLSFKEMFIDYKAVSLQPVPRNKMSTNHYCLFMRRKFALSIQFLRKFLPI